MIYHTGRNFLLDFILIGSNTCDSQGRWLELGGRKRFGPRIRHEMRKAKEASVARRLTWRIEAGNQVKEGRVGPTATDL